MQWQVLSSKQHDHVYTWCLISIWRAKMSRDVSAGSLSKAPKVFRVLLFASPMTSLIYVCIVLRVWPSPSMSSWKLLCGGDREKVHVIVSTTDTIYHPHFPFPPSKCPNTFASHPPTFSTPLLLQPQPCLGEIPTQNEEAGPLLAVSQCYTFVLVVVGPHWSRSRSEKGTDRNWNTGNEQSSH